MTDTSFFIDLLNKALENPAYILFGIGFILLCIFVGLLNRKARKANPEKYARTNASINATLASINATRASQDYSMGTVVINGQSHSVTRAGNTTYID